MASTAVTRPPSTLPANFNGWDKPAASPPKTLPADFSGWDKAATPPPSTVEPSAQPSLVQRVQNSFDTNTKTSPKEPLLETGLKSVVGAIGGPFVHPIKTATGLLDTVAGASPDYQPLPMKLPDGKINLPEERGNPLVDRGIQAYHDAKDGGLGYSATKLGGEALGGIALGEAGTAIPRGLGVPVEAIRSAAVGDPNAAALRGLGVRSGSNKALRTVSAVEGSRPFLQGSTSLEDLQSRIPAAKDEIWSPYKQAVEQIGDKQTRLGTIRDVEARRAEVSALVRGLKTGDPQALQLAQQKGLTQADLLQEEKSIKSVLDPELRAVGIDPTAIRQSYSNVGTVERRVQGKSTLVEPDKPYGFGKMVNLDLHKPLQAPGQILEGFRDIAAGRPLFRGKASDVNIREGFRQGGSKPDFGSVISPPSASRPIGYLPSETIGNPGGPDYSQGGFPSRPSIVTPSPAQLRTLPASASLGEALPMVGIKKTAYPSLAEDYARVRVSPNTFSSPEIIPPRGFIASPTELNANPLFLEANEPRGLLSPPKKKKR